MCAVGQQLLDVCRSPKLLVSASRMCVPPAMSTDTARPLGGLGSHHQHKTPDTPGRRLPSPLAPPSSLPDAQEKAARPQQGASAPRLLLPAKINITDKRHDPEIAPPNRWIAGVWEAS